MSLPPSFNGSGFTAGVVRNRVRLRNGRHLKPIMIGIDGPPDTGKTEFCHSAPGPGMMVCLDRGIEGMLDNPNPPSSRSADFAYKMITAPLAGQADAATFLKYWEDFYAAYKGMLANPDCVTAVIDGDSDSWELQRLAAFGKLTQVLPIQYVGVNSLRRIMYARAWDSGKIVLTTNKVKREYRDRIDASGKVMIGGDGKPLQEATGEMERQGFADQDYLFAIQLRTMY